MDFAGADYAVAGEFDVRCCYVGLVEVVMVCGEVVLGGGGDDGH